MRSFIDNAYFCALLDVLRLRLIFFKIKGLNHGYLFKQALPVCSYVFRAILVNGEHPYFIGRFKNLI